MTDIMGYIILIASPTTGKWRTDYTATLHSTYEEAEDVIDAYIGNGIPCCIVECKNVSDND